MKAILNSFIMKLKRQPPFAAAVLTIFIFSCPVLVSFITRGEILLPSGYTTTLHVEPIYGVVAIVIDIILLIIFGLSQFLRLIF